MIDVSKPLVVIHSITNYKRIGWYEETYKVRKVVELFVLFHLLVESNTRLYFASSQLLQSLQELHHALTSAVHVFHYKNMLSCDFVHLPNFYFTC